MNERFSFFNLIPPEHHGSFSQQFIRLSAHSPTDPSSSRFTKQLLHSASD
jgi:hypothetical protein